MTRVKRTILALILLELILAGLWYYLAGMAASSPNSSPDSGRVIGETMGTVMGVVLGLSPLLYLLARSNDRKAAAKSPLPGREGPGVGPPKAAETPSQQEVSLRSPTHP